MENENYSPIIGREIPKLKLQAFHENVVKDINLNDYNGKWLVLFFYPADFTFVCPTEFKDLIANYEAIKGEGAEVLTVSTDTVFVHKAWYDNSKVIKDVTFPMVADPTGKLCKALGTYIPEEGLSLRGTFIIDPDGVIKVAEIQDNSVGRNSAELLRKIQAIKFTREHGDQVCPANWKPGADTLKPGLDLVGKI